MFQIEQIGKLNTSGKISCLEFRDILDYKATEVTIYSSEFQLSSYAWTNVIQSDQHC